MRYLTLGGQPIQAGDMVVMNLPAGNWDPDYADEPDDSGDWLDGKGDAAGAVNVASPRLDVDLATHTAVATIALEKYGNVALEVGGLTVTDVRDDRGRRRHRIIDGTLRVIGSKDPSGFELCGDKQESCRFVRAQLDGAVVHLEDAAQSTAKRVRFCWADVPLCNLYDTDGLPVGPFELALD